MSVSFPPIPELSLLRTIALHARSRATKLAIDDAHGPTTFAELWARAHHTGEALAERGVRGGSPVVLALEPGADYVAAVLGTMLAGGVAVPLNTRLAPAEVGEFVAPVDAAVFLASPRHESLLDQIGDARTEKRTTGRLDATWATLRRLEKERPDRSDEALLLGTGGTTGVPKGSVFTHQALWHWVYSVSSHSDVRTTDHELFFAPFFHGTLITGLLTTLAVGGSATVTDGFDAQRSTELVASGKVTRLLGAVLVVDRLISAAHTVDMSAANLRLVQFGMSAARSRFAEEIKAALPSTEVTTGYGSTETGPVTRTYSWEFGASGDPIGVGRPVMGAEIVMETDGEVHWDRNRPGELLTRAPWQMKRYCLADESRDAAARAGHYLRSGDLGYFDDAGFLHISGRLKDTIRSAGETVYPAEVETALHRHAGVAECAVYGVRDAQWGERVEAAVVPAGDSLDLADLEAHLRRSLGGYKVPKRIRVLDALPLTTASKIDKRALQRAAEALESEGS